MARISKDKIMKKKKIAILIKYNIISFFYLDIFMY